MTQPPPKADPKIYPVFPCACGCGKTFEKKRSNQRFYGNHRNKLYDQINPRHRVGIRSTITIDGIRYRLVRDDKTPAS
jgi:hypothetical protein